MSIYKKLQEARLIIANKKMSKDGTNSFSKYDYFTPAMVSNAVADACEKVGLITLFSLLKDEYGHYGRLQVNDIDGDDAVLFEARTEQPEIKATNQAQQMGGMLTYTERYLKMSAFEIVDNNLDFDSQDNRPKKDDGKEWLNAGTDKWNEAVKVLSSGEFTIEQIEKKYKISKVNKEKLLTESNK